MVEPEREPPYLILETTMARDDGKRYGAGGALIETVEPQVEDAPTPKKKIEVLEERVADSLPSDVEPVDD